MVGIEDLCVELGRGANPTDIAVDDLGHADVSAIGHEVEGLCLHTC